MIGQHFQEIIPAVEKRLIEQECCNNRKEPVIKKFDKNLITCGL